MLCRVGTFKRDICLLTLVHSKGIGQNKGDMWHLPYLDKEHEKKVMIQSFLRDTGMVQNRTIYVPNKSRGSFYISTWKDQLTENWHVLTTALTRLFCMTILTFSCLKKWFGLQNIQHGLVNTTHISLFPTRACSCLYLPTQHFCITLHLTAGKKRFNNCPPCKCAESSTLLLPLSCTQLQSSSNKQIGMVFLKSFPNV